MIKTLSSPLNFYQIAPKVLLATLLAAQATAVYGQSFISQRDRLPANDKVVWSRLDSIFPLDVLPSDFSVISELGINASVSFPTPLPGITPPFVFITSAGGIETNFADGDAILFSGLMPGVFPSPGNPGPLTITFDEPVFAAGAQLAVDDTFTFEGTIEARDVNDDLLATFSTMGTSSIAVDNSAQFYGLRSQEANIAKLVFSSDIPGRAIGINQLSLLTTPIHESSSAIALLTLAIPFVFSPKRLH